MPKFHFSARARAPLTPFLDREVCAQFWLSMRRRFPHIQGLVLMPNHFHLILHSTDPSKIHGEIGVEMRALARRSSLREQVWEPLRVPEPLADERHVRRTLRYIYLNPCRSGLTQDPLAWEWSTYRDLFGAVVDPWVGLATEGFPRFHHYVSGDPSTQVQGTPLPQMLDRELYFPVSDLAAAVQVALRSGQSNSLELRRHVVSLAPLFCLATQKKLGLGLSLSVRQVRRMVAKPEPKMIRAVRLLLGDPRLRPAVSSKEDI